MNTSEKPFVLTESLEDYLEAIKELILDSGHGHAHTSSIAKRLNVRMPSVTNAMNVLREHGYVEYVTNRPVTLTEKGDREAERVRRRHRVLKNFFQRVLLLPEQEASDVACRIEHVVNDDLQERFAFLTAELVDTGRLKGLQKRLSKQFDEESNPEESP